MNADEFEDVACNTWWLCPNTPRCGHGAVLHDIYEPGDPSPTCCFEGCTCGQPKGDPDE